MNTFGSISRRQAICSGIGWSLGGLQANRAWSAEAGDLEAGAALKIARFRFTVTPPIGHSLCGGWIKPVVAIDDELEAIGMVILGADKPIVICAVDWTGLLNDAHLQWRRTLADAAGTSIDRVAVHCVHQHNAPFACLDAEQIVLAQKDLPHIIELSFFESCLTKAKKAVAEAIPKAQPITHIAHGQATIKEVASNRRVSRNAEGRIDRSRSSSCKDPVLRALPEGIIDPQLKTVAFYHNDQKLVACHYYATHPMSYYGDGRVTSDFVGLARKRRQKEEPNCTQLYFTGCAGNIAAGKYNDGSPTAREALTNRIYEGMVQSEKSLVKAPIDTVAWNTVDLIPTVRKTLNEQALVTKIANRNSKVVHRNRPSYQLSWLRRLQRKVPITLSCMHINQTSFLHLPAECFVQYQLRAQALHPDRFVATAAYGDGGPWYIPIEKEYSAGGYEVNYSFCEPNIDELLTKAISQLLG